MIKKIFRSIAFMALFLVLFNANGVSAMNSSIGTQSHTYIDTEGADTGIVPVDTSYTWGLPSTVWAKGFFNDLTITNSLTFSTATIGSDIDMNGYDIDNAGNINITVADTDNQVGLEITQNDTTNNPSASKITNTGSGLDIDKVSGILKIGGSGATNNENLIYDFETVANALGISSASGVADINYTGIDINTTTEVSAEHLISTDDADINDNLTVGDVIIDEAVGTLAFTGATSGTVSSSSGTVSIAATGGTNNEVLNIDCETTADICELTVVGSGWVSIPKLILGQLTAPEDGQGSMVADQSITSSVADNTEVGYNFGLDALKHIGIAGLSDGAGSVDGFFTRFYNHRGGSTNERFYIAVASDVTGASVTLTGARPDGATITGVTTLVTTALGATNGTTSYQIGDGTDVDRYGDSGAITLNTSTDNTHATADWAERMLADGDIVLTAVGGNFDGTGVIVVIVHYEDVTAPTS